MTMSFSNSFSGFNSEFSTLPVTTLDPNLKPWQSRPPYQLGESIVYNNNSVVYERRSPGTIVVPFFTVYWWLAIIILVIAVVILYAALCIWICCHFEKSEQKKAKKVVEAAYIENGFFDLDAYAEANGLQIQRSTSMRSAGGIMRGGAGSGTVANPYVKRGSDSDSVSGPEDERAFVEEEYENDDGEDDVNNYSGSDDDFDAQNVEVSSEDSANPRAGPYRMPMGRRRA